jgi:hypothetical protein
MNLEKSKGKHNIMTSEDKMVYIGCDPIKLKGLLTKAKNLIIALQPFIFGYVSFEEVEDYAMDKED